MEKPLVICLTPIKDEAWILERFLKCASTWADHIIIADQQSKDGSKEIARRFPKVTLIENNSESFN
ncbi:MAG: glycosyltransferase family 2 protein, partial [Chthoniobacterales bacterium]